MAGERGGERPATVRAPRRHPPADRRRGSMRDGVRLSADVYLPPADEPVPAVLVRTPYNNSDVYYMDQMRFWVARGYGFVVQDCRGKFDSEGEFRPWFNEPRGRLRHTGMGRARSRGATAAIGTTGSSYDGATQWLAAPLANPHLAAMVPAVVPSDYWAQDHYVGGAFAHGLNLSWAVRNAAAVRRELTPLETTRALVAPAAGRRGEAAAGTDIPWYREWLDHPAYDDFWRTVSTREHWASIARSRAQRLRLVRRLCRRRARALRRHGRARRRRRGRAAAQRLVMGPWHHLIGERIVGQVDFGPEAAVRHPRRWRRASSTTGCAGSTSAARDGAAAAPVLDGRSTAGAGSTSGRSRGRARTPLFLGARRAARGDRPPATPADADTFDYDPANPVMTTGGNHSLVHPGDLRRAVRPALRRGPRRRARLHGTRARASRSRSPGRCRPCSASRRPRPTRISLPASSTSTRTAARSTSARACCGRATATRSSTPTLLTPGEVYELTIDLGPTSNVFLPGHRVRLDISSSNFPRDRPQPQHRRPDRLRDRVAGRAQHRSSRRRAPVATRSARDPA